MHYICFDLRPKTHKKHPSNLFLIFGLAAKQVQNAIHRFLQEVEFGIQHVPQLIAVYLG